MAKRRMPMPLAGCGLAIFFLAVAAASCAHAESPGKLYGYVVSGTGIPLSSINVTAAGPGYVNFTYSNGEGRYEFPYALPPGRYNVSADCNCRAYGNATETGVVIESGRAAYLNITLNPPPEPQGTATPQATITPQVTPTPAPTSTPAPAPTQAPSATPAPCPLGIAVLALAGVAAFASRR